MERIIGIFDKYFFMLVLLESFITAFIDANRFKKSNMLKSYKQARYIGISMIIISSILYIIQIIIA